jgi:hypothetical protein
VSALRDELGTDPPDALVAALSPSEQDRLAAVIADARARQSAELDRALGAALGHVPFFARAVVKRMVS